MDNSPIVPNIYTMYVVTFAGFINQQLYEHKKN